MGAPEAFHVSIVHWRNEASEGYCQNHGSQVQILCKVRDCPIDLFFAQCDHQMLISLLSLLSQNQYKRQFGLWNISKAFSSKKKEKVTRALQTRSRKGKNTGVEFNGNDQSKAMRRYLKDKMRQDVVRLPNFSLSIENLSGHALQCGNRL